LFPTAIANLIVAVEAVEGALKLDGELWLARDGLGLAPLAGQLFPDAGPEIAIGGLIAYHGVVGDGNAGNLDDARLDGVDQREIGDDPWKERSFPVARPSKEERSRRQVVERPDADLIAHGFESRDPHSGFLIPLFGFGAILAF